MLILGNALADTRASWLISHSNSVRGSVFFSACLLYALHLHLCASPCFNLLVPSHVLCLHTMLSYFWISLLSLVRIILPSAYLFYCFWHKPIPILLSCYCLSFSLVQCYASLCSLLCFPHFSCPLPETHLLYFLRLCLHSPRTASALCSLACVCLCLFPLSILPFSIFLLLNTPFPQ